MNVGELKRLLNEIPDNYKVRSRAKNAHLRDDETTWQIGFSGTVMEVNTIDSQESVMLIRDFE